MPDCPEIRVSQELGTSIPTGLTVPSPVITTRFLYGDDCLVSILLVLASRI